MKDKKVTREPGELRLLAEEALQKGPPRTSRNPHGLPPGEAERLLHELNVHQVELEMQNEELRRAQLELEESRSAYFELYDLAPAGYLVLDRHGLIREANLTVSQLLDMEREALRRQPLSRFIAGGDRDSFYLQYKKLMKNGGKEAFEMNLLRSDGARLWARLELAATGDEGEEPSGSRVMIIDITGRKQAEEALRESENRLNWELASARLLQDFSVQLIQAGNIEALYEKTLDILIELLHADCASLKLFSRGEGEDGRLQLLGHRGFGEEAAKSWETIDLHTGSISCRAVQMRQRVVISDLESPDYLDGSIHMQLYQKIGLRTVQSTPLITRTGTVLGAFATYWRKPHRLTESESRALDVLARQVADLMESKQVQDALAAAVEKLLEADRQKDEFIGLLSHEIRNPLASIMLSLSLLEMKGLPDHRPIQIREVMKRQAAQLSRLVDDMLDVTRIKRGKMELQKEPMALDEMLRRTVDDFKDIFQEKETALEIEPLPAGLYVNADAVRLTQAVGNLLHNAAKFTGAGGLTRVSLQRDDQRQCALIRVADNGIGMNPEVLRNLFIPFRQADTSLEHSSGGLGMGLALVKGLVEMHGGEVWAQSDGPGQGSLFTVSLPLFTGSPAAAAEAAPAASCRSLRVLVIEDIQDVADSLAQLLAGEGHEVAVAYNGAAGVVRAKDFRPDVLLCDIGLPGMDGYQVARAFRADRDLKETYLVSLTGYARPEDVRKAKEAGFDRHLAKPVNLAIIRETLSAGRP